MTKAQFTNKEHYRWDLWEAGEGMMGTCFAHGYLDPADTLIVYDAPETLDVQVRDGEDLTRTANTPMTRLRMRDKKVVRDEIWPHDADYEDHVLLSGGETGTLLKCLSYEDRQEWHVDIEFSRHS